MENKNIIPEIPEVKQEIIDAINTKNLVIFIGAGVSRLVGCKGWNELARSLVYACFEKKIISFKEMENLNLNNDSKKIITICYHLLEKNGFNEEFYNIMNKSLEGNDDKKIYENITKLSGICVTTNADELFHNYFEKDRIVYKNFSEKIFSEEDPTSMLYQIHGMIKDRGSLVFRVKEYLNKYNNINFQGFLNKIFNKYTVLFVGYGLEEFELLDYILTKAKTNRKHYMLYPAYKDDINIVEFEKEYYKDLGIELLPYQKDKRGYHQLINILSDWEKIIRYDSEKIGIGQEDIDKAITNTDISLLRQKIKAPELRKHFYREILKKEELKEKIIDFIITLNILNMDEIPKCNEKNNRDYWEELIFFDDIISKNIMNLNENQKEKINNIIKNLINEILEKRIKNFRSNEIILKLLLLLKDSELNLKEKDFFNHVLKEEGDSFRFDNYLRKNIFPKLILEKNEKLLNYLIKECLGYKIKDFGIKSIIGDYNFKQLFNNQLKEINSIIGDNLFKNIKDIIRSGSLSEKDYFDNYAIEELLPSEEFDNYSNQYQNQLIQVFLQIIEFYKGDECKYRDLIIELYNDNEIKIFKRISLYLMAMDIDNYKNLILEDLPNLLEKVYLKFELFMLLKENIKYFTKDELKKIIDIIESNVENDYKIKEWLEALKETNDKYILKKYKEISKKYPQEIKHPGRLFWSETGDYEPKTPLLKEKIITLLESNENILFDTLKEYENKIGIFIEGPSKEGLCNELEEAVKYNNAIFSKNIDKFINIDDEYYYFIIRGFENIIKSENKIENFLEILNSINIKIKKSDLESGDNNKAQLKYLISLYLETALRNLKTISEDELNLIFKILNYYIQNLPNDTEKSDDSYGYLINSINGRYYCALVKLLEIVNKKNNNNLKNKILFLLKEKVNKDINANIAIASYLNFFMGVANEWTEEILDELFDFSKRDFIWVTIEGYLCTNNILYKDIFIKMERKYNELIENLKDFKSKKGRKALIDHLLLAYFNFENDDKKIERILELSINLEDIYLLILSFLSHRKNLNKIKSKKLWKKIALKIDVIQDKDQLASKLFKSLINTGKIDKAMIITLKEVISYFNNYPYNILKTFYEIIDNNNEYIGDLLIEFAFNKIFFDEREKELLNKILNEIKIKHEDKIRRIVNIYKEDGRKII